MQHKVDHIKQNQLIARNYNMQQVLKQSFGRSILNKNNKVVLERMAEEND